MSLHRCPDCRCDEPETRQPSTSSEWARRAALEAAKAAVRASKDRRKKPREVES